MKKLLVVKVGLASRTKKILDVQSEGTLLPRLYAEKQAHLKEGEKN